MPYPSDHAQRTRARIVRSAMVLFNRHGLEAVSIDRGMLVDMQRQRPARSVAARSGARSVGGDLASVGLLQLLLRGLGSEAEDVTSGVGADAHEDVAQVVVGTDAVQAARGEDGVENAGTL